MIFFMNICTYEERTYIFLHILEKMYEFTASTYNIFISNEPRFIK